MEHMLRINGGSTLVNNKKLINDDDDGHERLTYQS